MRTYAQLCVVPGIAACLLQSAHAWHIRLHRSYTDRPGTVYLSIEGQVVPGTDTIAVIAGARFYHVFIPKGQRTFASITLGAGSVLDLKRSYSVGAITIGASGVLSCAAVADDDDFTLTITASLCVFAQYCVAEVVVVPVLTTCREGCVSGPWMPRLPSLLCSDH